MPYTNGVHPRLARAPPVRCAAMVHDGEEGEEGEEADDPQATLGPEERLRLIMSGDAAFLRAEMERLRAERAPALSDSDLLPRRGEGVSTSTWRTEPHDDNERG